MVQTDAAATATDVPPDVPPDAILIQLFTLATKLKLCDERFRAMLMSGQSQHMYYSPRGQEFIAAGVAACLRPDDYLVTTYRGMHDQVAKGINLRSLWAEYYGRRTGSCKGKGGPMHITDRESGVMVTTGVVGSGIPIANGFGMAAKVKGTDQVTVANFGDGASNIGAFHEAMNLASLWALPVIFVCQNNRYAEYTRYEDGTTAERISDRGLSYSMAAVTVDGNDPIAMYQAAREAVNRARSGAGPTLIEALTYRFHGHNFGDTMAYMPREERKAAMAADPVPRFRKLLVDGGHATPEQLEEIESSLLAEIEDAVQFALESPPPDPSELYDDVYSERVPQS